MSDLFSGVVLAKVGHLVLVTKNRKYGGISLPGGKGEPGETPDAAASREFVEETGLYVMGLTPIAKGPSCMEEERIVHVFWADGISGDLKPEEGGDVYLTTWKRLLQESPFSRFYLQHFPYGIWYLNNTEWSFAR